MKEVVLTDGEITLVDDIDFERLSAFRWKAHHTRNGDTYAERHDYRKGTIGMASFILDAPKGTNVDHKNHKGLDNQRQNIRICTPSQNSHNQRVHRNPKTSVFKGVSLRSSTKKWYAGIKTNGKDIHLGVFRREIEAALAYDAAARELFGDFAYTNFIEV